MIESMHIVHMIGSKIISPKQHWIHKLDWQIGSHPCLPYILETTCTTHCCYVGISFIALPWAPPLISQRGIPDVTSAYGTSPRAAE